MRKMTGEYAIGSTGTVYRYYACKKPVYDKIDCDVLEQNVLCAVLKFIEDGDLVKSVSRATANLFKEQASKTDCTALKRELSCVRARKSNIVKAVEETGYYSELKKRLDELTAEEIRIESAIHKATASVITAKDIEKKFRAYIKKPPRAMEQGIFKYLVSKVIVWEEHIDVYLTTNDKIPPNGTDGSSSSSSYGTPRNVQLEPNLTVYCRFVVLRVQKKSQP